jgi:SAM-dependent methyltransferase
LKRKAIVHCKENWMANEKQTTSSTNGPLWGERAEDWANIQEGQCRLVYQIVLSRFISHGTRYCDAGCGAGMAAQIAHNLEARVSGLDASEALLQIARSRVPSADLRHGELEELPFGNASFDLVTGFNSFQYAAHPVEALREAKRITIPGGTVVIMTWGDPAGMPAAQLVAALKPLLPPPPPGAPGPFALSDKSALEAFASSAGLETIEIVDVDCPWQYPDLSTAVRGFGSSGVAAKARANSGDEAVDKAHEEVLSNFQQPDGSYRIGASFRCLFAKA